MAARKPLSRTPTPNEPEAGDDESGSYDVDLEAVRIIRQHRKLFGTSKKSAGDPLSSGIMRLDSKAAYAEVLTWRSIFRFPEPPRPAVTFKESVPPGLEPILVMEIDHKVNKVYANRVLLLTLTEDPSDECRQTTLIGRDQEWKAVEVFITHLPQTEEFHELLAFGTQIGIIDPCYRVKVRGIGNFIEVGPDQIIRLGKKTEMCRYCGEENSPRKCSICMATYCSRKCQVADWKELNHKAICKK